MKGMKFSRIPDSDLITRDMSEELKRINESHEKKFNTYQEYVAYCINLNSPTKILSKELTDRNERNS